MLLTAGIIINADDLGIHPNINAGILSAYCNGILTSSTMLVTTDYLELTLRDYVRLRVMPIGIHLSLTLGKAVAPVRDVANLVDERGYLKLSAKQLLLNSFAGAAGAKLHGQIRREFEAQLARAHDGGLRPTHADSHQHVHMNPQIFRLVEDLLPRFGIDRLRLSREPLPWFALGRDLPMAVKRLNPAKWAVLRWRAASIRPGLATNDDFYGMINSGLMGKSTLARIIAAASDAKAVEICMHPGFPAPNGAEVYPQPEYNRFISSAARQIEHDVLLDGELATLLRRRGLTLRGYDGREKAV
jgi:predicted glycoside hydrolase/deacetylase ChbG (UPF0249 family)